MRVKWNWHDDVNVSTFVMDAALTCNEICKLIEEDLSCRQVNKALQIAKRQIYRYLDHSSEFR